MTLSPSPLSQVFGGFLVNLSSMLSWLSWLQWISIFRYGLNVREKGRSLVCQHFKINRTNPLTRGPEVY